MNEKDTRMIGEKSLKKSYVLIFTTFLVFVLATSWFGYVLAIGVDTDIQEHVEYVLNFALGAGSLPRTFLFYALVFFLSGNGESTNLQSLYIGAAFVLGVSVALRYFVTYKYLSIAASAKWEIGQRLAIVAALGMLLAFSIPTDLLYRETMPPNVWHNSTTILLMPFAILLYWKSAEQLDEPDFRNIPVVCALVVLNAIAKPSLLLAFLPIYPIFLLTRFGLSKQFIVNCTPVFVGIIAIALLYLSIYTHVVEQVEVAESGVGFQSLLGIKERLLRLPVSIILSSAFPILYVLLYPVDVKDRVELRFAIALWLMAIAISLLLVETGPRAKHGNFFWGVIACNYLFYCVSLKQLLIKLKESSVRSPKNALLLGVFGLHVIFGINYLVRMTISKTFWI